MSHRAAKYLLFLTLSALVSLGIIVFSLSLRLSQGPIELTFLTPLVQTHVARSFPEVAFHLEAVILEWEQGTAYPRVRLRNLRVENKKGHLLLQAPKAQFSFSFRSLLSGGLKIYTVELIGPKVLVKRKLDGRFEMGFGDFSTLPAPSPPIGDLPSQKAMDVLSEMQTYFQSNPSEDVSFWQAFENIKIKKASFSLYDEINQMVWSSPVSYFSFKKADFGFILFADAVFATRSQPWRAEAVATYRFDRRIFSLRARVFDMIPSAIAQQTFAFSQFAQMQVPLSGQAELEIGPEGKILKASAELSVSRGSVAFPHYISNPLMIEEGLIRLDYDPKTGAILLDHGELFMPGMKSQLTGKIEVFKEKDGLLKSLLITLSSHHQRLTEGTSPKIPLDFEEMSFSGTAFLQDQRFEVNQFSLRSGERTLSLSGYFEGGGKAMGVFLNGGFERLPIDVFKKIWPDVVGPSAHAWVEKNIYSGLLTKGAFRVALTPDHMERALSGEPLPQESVDFSFEAVSLKGAYYKTLPPIEDLSVKARVTGTTLHVEMTNGVIQEGLPGKVRLVSGTLDAQDISGDRVPAQFVLTTHSEISSALRVLNHSPLFLLKGEEAILTAFSGHAVTTTRLEVPLGERKEGDLKVEILASVQKASYQDKTQGKEPALGFQNGDLRFQFKEGLLTAEGEVSAFGERLSLKWHRDLTLPKEAPQFFSLEGTLKDRTRLKWGWEGRDFVKGDLPFQLSGTLEKGDLKEARGTLDLSKATVRYPPLRWTRLPHGNLQATYDLKKGKDGEILLSNLSLKGERAQMEGGASFKNGQIVSADFSRIFFGGLGDFQLKFYAIKDKKRLELQGKTLDLRLFLQQIFASSGQGESIPPVDLEGMFRLNSLKTNHGETLSDVLGTFSFGAQAQTRFELSGTFAQGGSVHAVMEPLKNGDRLIRVSSHNGGAVLRSLDLYSKISGGTFDLRATLKQNKDLKTLRGIVVMRHFEIKNEPSLLALQQTSQKRKGPRSDLLKFSRMRLPFSADGEFFYIGDALIQGSELGASAHGTLRTKDGAMDIKGTVIPMYALNSLLGNFPILGDVLMGGRGQGVFGMNFSLQGSLKKPFFSVNPVSALAPGFLRQLFSVGEEIDFDKLPTQ